MDHFFILGNHRELSVAELTARFDFKKLRLLDEVLLGSVLIPDSREAMRTLGGAIKLGRLIGKVSKRGIYDKALAELLAAPKQGKFNFGISIYGKSNINVQKLGLELKSAVKSTGVSCRFVTSREKQLSSVVVEQNRLTRDGRELVFIAESNSLWFGVTEAVQPFKDLSHRDYGRPARDDYSGMLPPKLAQIMINLARASKEGKILDPFCGSGTILTEALLLGFKNIMGSDISEKAISDSKKNIEWTKKIYNLKISPELKVGDALHLSKIHKAQSINSIITETYLGPQRGRMDYKKVSADLKDFYSKVLKEFEKIIKPRGRIVLALPVFMNGQKKINPAIPLSFTKKDSFIYGREGQRVYREIVVLDKNKYS